MNATLAPALGARKPLDFNNARLGVKPFEANNKFFPTNNTTRAGTSLMDNSTYISKSNYGFANQSTFSKQSVNSKMSSSMHSSCSDINGFGF